MMPVANQEIQPHISRCSVCQAPTPLVTLHSQRQTTPSCPTGWSRIWEGYSFVMVNCIILQLFDY